MADWPEFGRFALPGGRANRFFHAFLVVGQFQIIEKTNHDANYQRRLQRSACVGDILHIHLTSARTETASGSAHALDLTGLQSLYVSFWKIWDGETLPGSTQ